MMVANPKRRSTKPPKSRLGLWTAIAIFALLGGYLLILDHTRPQVSGDSLRLDTFVELAEKDRIRDARILDQDSYVVGTYVRDDNSVAPYNVAYTSMGTEGLIAVLLANDVHTTVEQQFSKSLLNPASLLLPALIIVVVLVYVILSYRRSTGLFGIRSGARKITPEQARVTFADVAGQDPAVAELREIKQFLSQPERFAALGVAVPKGVLLYGPPGCGKTLLARALAGEAGAAFYSMSGSDFVELYVGVGAARVRDLFREARQNAPAIVFIDELDSIGRTRGAVTAAATHSEQEQALNQVLAEMDGVSASEGIIVLAATNRPDILDQALLRPGRFDRTIGLERPDEGARLAILSLHARGKRLHSSADLAAVARRAIGLTGADLANVVNEGALLAARAGRSAVSQADLDQALQRILEAPERQRRLALRERSIARRFAAEERVTFSDVAGVDDAIEELAEVKEYLANPERFLRAGARVPRGILLVGPPGCGKTLLARAVAGEANAAFFSAAASEFVEAFVGEGAGRVRELFAEARSVAPAIVFMDEIDAIGAHRPTVSLDGHREREQTLNQILVELDGFETRTGVIVMAATNRPDILDPALVRPGRFDRQVSISFPDRAGRRAVLALHARDKRLAADVDLGMVAGLTQGFSGADLANVVNEAALLAARRGLDEIPMALVEEGIDRAVLGVASRGTVMSEHERRITACHEVGHALVAMALPTAAPPHKLTIIPRGASLGRCTVVDTHDRVIQSRSMMMDEMAVLLAGRAAEAIVFGEPASGSAHDLEQASSIARRMVCELGMSSAVGPRAYGDASAPGGQRPYSPDTARVIDAEITQLLNEADGRAHQVLLAWRGGMDRVVEVLLERETMALEELQELAQADGPAEVAAPTPS